MLKHQTGKSPSIAKAIGAGTLTAVICAFLGAAILAKLADLEILKLENIGYGIMIVHLLSVFLGAGSARTRAGKEGTIAAAAAAGAYYLCLLMVNGLFFGGSFTGLGTTLLLTVLAGLGAILTGEKGGRRNARKRYKIPK